jgi:hypothetical protein
MGGSKRGFASMDPEKQRTRKSSGKSLASGQSVQMKGAAFPKILSLPPARGKRVGVAWTLASVASR